MNRDQIHVVSIKGKAVAAFDEPEVAKKHARDLYVIDDHDSRNVFVDSVPYFRIDDKPESRVIFILWAQVLRSREQVVINKMPLRTEVAWDYDQHPGFDLPVHTDIADEKQDGRWVKVSGTNRRAVEAHFEDALQEARFLLMRKAS